MHINNLKKILDSICDLNESSEVCSTAKGNLLSIIVKVIILF